MFMFQTLKLVPGGEIAGLEYEAIPILLFGVAGLVLILVPFLDRNAARGLPSRGWSIFGLAALLFVIGMTCWGYMSFIPLYIVIITGILLLLFALITRGSGKPESR